MADRRPHRTRLALAAFLFGLAALTVAPSAQQGAQDEFVPGELIVQFRSGVTEGQRGTVRSAHGVQTLKRYQQVRAERVRIQGNANPIALARALSAQPEVEAAQPNFIRRTTSVGSPNDPFFVNGDMWGLTKISAPLAWSSFGAGATTVVVADIDTGVNYNHPDLAANMWLNPGEIAGNGIDDDQNGYVDDIYGIDTANNDSNPIDDHGHGTHTSGTIGAVSDNGIGIAGLAKNVKILVCKFISAATGTGTDADAIECFNYVVAMKQRGVNVRVTNNSWGRLRGQGGIATALKNAIDAAGNAGIVNVFAAGNDGVNIDVTPADPASFTSPSIISVAASDEGDARASFSNYGAVSVDLAAPGTNVLSTFAGFYAHSSGTSMAAPHVAGVAALLLAHQPSLTVAQVKDALLNSVDPVGLWSGFVATGGRLNAFGTLNFSLGGPSATAAFVGTDPTTQGSWIGVYGIDGYALANDATALPSYAQVVWAGQLSHTWAASTTDPRALQRPAGTDRLAATWYSGTSYTIDVNITDGATHQVALYNLDWDGGNVRAQRVDVLDATTGAVLDTRTVTAFSSGQYLVWTIGGHVTFRVTNTGPANAVVSGLFFSPPASPGSPSITTQPASQTITSGQAATLSVVATGTAPLTYQWYVGPSGTTTTPIAGATTSSYTTPALTTTTSYWVGISNASGTANSATATITVVAGGGTTATFVGTDPTTQGSWIGVYGIDGYALANDATALPSYAQVVWAGQLSHTWAASTTDPRALQRPAGTDRLAATWYSGTSYTIDVNITDGATHQVALYNLDWDGGNVRAQRVDVLDATTGAVLDTRTVTAFSSGQYLVWTIGGHVTFRVTNTGPANAVVSGLFFSPPASPGSPSITTQPASQTITSGQAATLSVVATGTAPLTYQWYVGPSGTTTTPIAGATTSSYTTPALTTTTSYWVGISNASGTANSATATITVVAGGGTTATFVGTDPTTQGSWIGVYGIDGYALANDATALPSYAQVVWAGQLSHTWAASTTDPRALQRPAGTDRLAATWYSGTSYTIDVNITDGATHQVALYNLDWDGGNVRAQRVDVLDATTGAVLDTRTVTAFSSGQYLVWTIGGHVTFRVTNTGPANAVVSGLFFR